MTTNIDRAADIINSFCCGYCEYFGEEQSHALADAGLITPDLPEANDPTASFVPGGKGWLLEGSAGPVVWTAPGGLVMVQRIEPGDLTPEQARVVASHFLAAADYAEGAGRADA